MPFHRVSFYFRVKSLNTLMIILYESPLASALIIICIGKFYILICIQQLFNVSISSVILALSKVCEKANSVKTATVDAPTWIHKYIIGKNGSNIKKITQDFSKVTFLILFLNIIYDLFSIHLPFKMYYRYMLTLHTLRIKLKLTAHLRK